MGDDRGRLRMRDVCARTGLARSTIHHYIREGVLPKPRKTGRNTAFYGEDFVRRVRLVRTLQERARMPLAEIREALSAMPDVDAVDVERFADIARAVADELRLASEKPLARSEILDHTGLTADQLDGLETAGLVDRADGSSYSVLDARIAKAFARLFAAGVPLVPGYEEVLGAYRKHLGALARAEARQMVRMMRTLTEVDLPGFIRRSAEPVGDLIAALHQKALVRAVTELTRNGGR